jgi:hypothetical protein
MSGYSTITTSYPATTSTILVVLRGYLTPEE